jgi:hypothetical protein
VVVDALNRKNKVGIGGLWGEKHEGLTKLGKMRAQLCLRVDGSSNLGEDSRAQKKDAGMK